jgi:hypothetical protein
VSGSQLDLFRDRDQPDTDPSLTPRQRFALAFVKATGIVQADELGAALHEYRQQEGGRGHRADTRCRFCPDEGRDMAAALERKGLVKRVEGGIAASDYQAPAKDRYDPQTADWPEGF